MTRSLPRLSLPHLSDEAVASYADGVLPVGPRTRAQHHLAECVDCSAAVRDQQAARILLRAATAPAAPGALLERLRQLPTSAPSDTGSLSGLTMDGQPVFAAFHTRERQAASSMPAAPSRPAAPSPMSVPALSPLPIAPVRSLTAAPGPVARLSRRSHLPVLGVSAAAAATLIVGVLAGTAATAGGGTAAPNQRQVSVPTVPATTAGGTAPILNLIGSR